MGLVISERACRACWQKVPALGAGSSLDFRFCNGWVINETR